MYWRILPGLAFPGGDYWRGICVTVSVARHAQPCAANRSFEWKAIDGQKQCRIARSGGDLVAGVATRDGRRPALSESVTP